MAAPQASSRLELLQARFQQKQLQEKEQKLLQLYDQQQQRAYQVVQRGSPGSNGSNHGSSISQHTVTKTTTSSHTTSTLQGGKVRQMFDERRQTTVKGIDRSYPLEPLENKPRKQTNGNGVQRNGNLTVNRQSVTVKRVARADVNSNLNGGKPVVSYHEEITRESFGPSEQQHADDDEFGNENRVAQYENGNHRDEAHIEEVLSEDAIQRNRMMAKLHLMEYDETLKHRVKNDLDSEEFPEDLMVDVPDKLPKQSVAKKLSQAEARLERFKNANARRSNSIAKNTAAITVPKKRSDPAFPAKSTPRGNQAIESRTRKIAEKGSLGKREDRRNGKLEVASEKMEESLLSYGSESNAERKNSGSPKFLSRESDKFATTYAIHSKTDRAISPTLLKDRKRRSESPKYFCKESEKSATTYAIDSKTMQRFSPELPKDTKLSTKTESRKNKNKASGIDRNIRNRSVESSVSMGIDTVDKNIESPERRRVGRTPSPKDLKKIGGKDEAPSTFERRREHSTSPQFLGRESKNSRSAKSPELLEKIVRKRSDSPRALSGKREASARTARSPEFSKRTTRKVNTSPQSFPKDSDRSSTIMLVTPETITKPRTKSPKPKKGQGTSESSVSKPDSTLTSRLAKASRKMSEEDIDATSKYDIRSSVSRFFSEQCERAARNANHDEKDSDQIDRRSDLSRGSSPVSLKNMKVHASTNKSPFFLEESRRRVGTMDRSSSRESSPESRKILNSRDRMPEFFCYETEKSATTVSLKPKSVSSKGPRLSHDSSINIESKSLSADKSPTRNIKIPADRSKDIVSPRPQKIVDNRTTSPEFYCYETERSATTVSLESKSSKSLLNRHSKSPEAKSRISPSVQVSDKLTERSRSFTLHKEIKSTSKSSSRDASPRSQKIVDSRNTSPEFYETEKSATTVSLKPTSVKSSIDERSKSSSKNIHLHDRPLKSPEHSALSKDSKLSARRGFGNVLRSTKLIRDILEHQSKNENISRKKESQRASGASENVNGMSGSEDAELKYQSREDGSREVEGHRDIDKIPPAREILTSKPIPRSSSSTEVAAEIQEITLPDRYIKQERLQREQLRDTYSKSKSSHASKRKSKTEGLLAYSAHRSGKKRGSLFESSIFEASRRDREPIDHRGSSISSGRAGQVERCREKAVDSETTRNASSNERSCSPLAASSSRRGADKNAASREKESKTYEVGRPRPTSRKRTASPGHPRGAETRSRLEGSILGDSKKHRRSPTPRSQRQPQALRSMELVRRIMKESSSNEREELLLETVSSSEIASSLRSRIESTRSESTSRRTETIDFTNQGESSDKNYERTDSVESALRRFDSIDTEAGAASARSTLERSKGSIAGERRTEVEPGAIEGERDDSKTISLKALDRGNANSARCAGDEPPRTSSRRASMTGLARASCEPKAPKTRETRRQKKFARARDSMEIARSSTRAKSPACKRKLFQEADSGEETETGSSKSKCSFDSKRTAEREKTEPRGGADSPNVGSKFLKSASSGKLSKEADEASTGDRSLSVKQLRSIEDIRKSIDGESSLRRAKGASSKSAIANGASRRSIRLQSRRASSHERVESRNELEEELGAKKNTLGDFEGSVSYSTRFPRVAKSPSPDSTKTMDANGRVRRNLPSSPSKSPDTVTRRPSADLKVQDTKSSKRSVPTKGTEPIGNRKTTTTTTRKSTDVVDGAILENGLHLRGQTTETKYDNDPATTKKSSDAFVIDFDEEPPKETDAPTPRKPLMRKQSTEKQTPSTQSARPPSAISSTSSGSSMQASVIKGKMASKAKTPISGTTTSKGSAFSKGGGNQCAVDSLVPCKVCGRRFAQERVILHEQICSKAGQKKRKQFDAMMHRVRGTELEQFVRRGIGTCKKMGEKSKKTELKPNWRRKHEDFINAIRSAKQVQAHLAAGGKLSDLPPPPASDTSDYIQCPHCGRKFNQPAAERHIPKCEHMLHNKPVHSRAPKLRR